MDTRVEIFRDDLWRRIRLQDEKAIKYNALINLIGKITSREISHTNTFVLPPVFENTQALGVNSFNKNELARALNSKYPARFYVEDKLLQEGFLIINNTTNGEINVNFIDGALDITEKWGSITLQELIISDLYTKPVDYQKAILEMRNYLMDKTTVLKSLSEVESRGYNLALFPNNLNTIGDAFQKNREGYRQDDSFNPYQSRPIFNTKALFDLAVETFGYTPIYDPSVNWEKVSKTFIVDEGLGESENTEDEGQIETTFPTVGVQGDLYYTGRKGSGTISTVYNFVKGTERTRRPMDIPGWVNPPGQLGSSNRSYREGAIDYRQQYTVLVPEIEAAAFGKIKYSSEIYYRNDDNKWTEAYSVWENANQGGSVLFNKLDTDSEVESNNWDQYSVTIDKTELRNVPAGSNGKLIGIIHTFCNRYHLRRHWRKDYGLKNIVVRESYALKGVVSYDEYGQYITDAIDLTHAAPKTTIKKLLISAMQKEGILMSINSKTKTVKFFTYGAYNRRREDGIFYDWSEYLQKYDPFIFNTDYGDSYAKKNQIGLTDPYIGNTFTKNITNQGKESKYKDFTQNLVEGFKDVSSIKSVENTTYPYFEYENKGLGLVEAMSGTITGLQQINASGDSQGLLEPLSLIANVNYAELPGGVKEWYDLVERAVKGQATFLLPVDVVKELDLSIPVYIEEMGGFYIIEEISEYMNAQTQVKVKLIKLIDGIGVERPRVPSAINLIGEYTGNSFYRGSSVKVQISMDLSGGYSGDSQYAAELENDYVGIEFGADMFTESVYEGLLELANRTLDISGEYQGISDLLGELSISIVPYQDNILKIYSIPLSELTATPENTNIESLVSEWFTSKGLTIGETESIGWESGNWKGFLSNKGRGVYGIDNPILTEDVFTTTYDGSERNVIQILESNLPAKFTAADVLAYLNNLTIVKDRYEEFYWETV